jgi:hypothetical protein
MQHRKYASKIYGLKKLYGDNWKEHLTLQAPQGRIEEIVLAKANKILRLSEGAGRAILQAVDGLTFDQINEDIKTYSQVIRKEIQEGSPLSKWAEEFWFLYHFMPKDSLKVVEEYFTLSPLELKA